MAKYVKPTAEVLEIETVDVILVSTPKDEF